jgi:hypothetical protein
MVGMRVLPQVEFDFANFFKTWAFFNVTNKFLRRKYSKKQSENIISGIHAVFSLVFSGPNDIKRLRWFSSAYFVHDFLQLFFSKKLNIMKLGYMYHHLSGIYLLTQDSREVPVRDMLFWGEISNLPSYPLYHYLHQNNNADKQKIIFFQILQKTLYTGIRIPLLSHKLINYLMTTKTYKHLFAILPVYLMGILWGGKIVTQSIKYTAEEGEDIAELVENSFYAIV